VQENQLFLLRFPCRGGECTSTSGDPQRASGIAVFRTLEGHFSCWDRTISYVHLVGSLAVVARGRIQLGIP